MKFRRLLIILTLVVVMTLHFLCPFIVMTIRFIQTVMANPFPRNTTPEVCIQRLQIGFNTYMQKCVMGIHIAFCLQMLHQGTQCQQFLYKTWSMYILVPTISIILQYIIYGSMTKTLSFYLQYGTNKLITWLCMFCVLYCMIVMSIQWNNGILSQGQTNAIQTNGYCDTIYMNVYVSLPFFLIQFTAINNKDKIVILFLQYPGDSIHRDILSFIKPDTTKWKIKKEQAKNIALMVSLIKCLENII